MALVIPNASGCMYAMSDGYALLCFLVLFLLLFPSCGRLAFLGIYMFFFGCINNANINAHCPVITLTLYYLCTELGTGERNEKERINDLNIPN